MSTGGGGRGTQACGPFGLRLGAYVMWGGMSGSGSSGAHIHHCATLYPDLVVITNGWQLVLVQTDQAFLSVAGYVLAQLLQGCVGKELSPALNILRLLTELVAFGSQVWEAVKISTVSVGPRVAAIYPISPIAVLLFAFVGSLQRSHSGL